MIYSALPAFKKVLLLGPVFLALITGAFLWGNPAPSQAQMAAAHAGSESDAQKSLVVESGLMGVLQDPQATRHSFFDVAALRGFYESRDNEPAWVRGRTRYQYKAHHILEVLEESWTHGLDPRKYHISEIKALLDAPFGQRRFELELLLSDALILYGRDLTGMRIDPEKRWGKIPQKVNYWRRPLEAREILERVSGTSDVKNALRSLEPEGKLYGALRRELVALASQPAEDGNSPLHFKGVLRVGDEHKAVADIRRYMGMDPEKALNGKYYYDDELAQEIMAFQYRHGLEPDGVIGPQTVALMNVTRQDKINQIVANLERLRWVEQNKPDRYILVNIPSATLWAVDQGAVKLEMPVIVGKKGRPTNSFKTEITGVRFNPNWTVPPTIKRDDFLPRLKEDPYYLSKRGIQITKGSGRNARHVDPATIDWNTATQRDLGQIRMVQSPGRSNPLGQVRVIMENPYNIYLHDTNKPEYFKKNSRALSSGCIRVSKPKELAAFILDKNDGWSAQKAENILASGRLTDIMTDEPLPVYILYQSVWQDDRGRIVFGADLYGQDRQLIEALSGKKGFQVPENLVKSASTLPLTGKKSGLELGSVNQ